MIVVAFLIVATFVAWRLSKRRRAAELSGTVAVKPVFSVEPPRRRLSSIKGERL